MQRAAAQRRQPPCAARRAQVRSSFESDMRLQFGNLNFSGRGFSNDFSAAAEDHAAASAGYDAGPAAAAAQALAEPPAPAPAASSSSAMDAFKAAGARGRAVPGSASVDTPPHSLPSKVNSCLSLR